MNFIKRAWLYMIRNKAKSFLLFVVLFIMAAFVLTTLSIKKAADIAQINLRHSLGGEFQISFDYTDNNPYLHTDQVEGGVIMYSSQQITPELVEQIRKIQGVSSCDAYFETMVNFPDLSYFAGNIAVDEEFKHSTKVIGTWKSEENSLFTSGKLQLTEGRHIMPQDDKKAIISQDLANKNGLKLGDKIKTDKAIEVEIVGLFTPCVLEAFSEQVTTYDKIQNCIFTDIASLIELENGPAIQGFNELIVSVEDPKTMDEIIAQVKRIDSVDWKAFSISSNTESYDHASTSLWQLSHLTAMIFIVVCVVSAVILSLILTMWSKTRIHETGILLSIGISKLSILGQYIAEVLFIALLAFSISYLPSKLMTDQVEKRIQPFQGMDTQIQEDGSVTDKSNEENEENDLHISIQTEQVVLLFMIGTGIVVIASSIASMTVMRLKPREILSKMS